MTRESMTNLKLTMLGLGLLLVAACSPNDSAAPVQEQAGSYAQPLSALVSGEVMAMAYSGFREGQHPDRGDGAVNPSDEDILEDLQILIDHGFGLIRLYDAK